MRVAHYEHINSKYVGKNRYILHRLEGSTYFSQRGCRSASRSKLFYL